MTDDKQSLWSKFTDLNPPGWPLILVCFLVPVLWPRCIYLLYRRIKFSNTRLPENRQNSRAEVLANWSLRLAFTSVALAVVPAVVLAVLVVLTLGMIIMGLAAHNADIIHVYIAAPILLTAVSAIVIGILSCRASPDGQKPPRGAIQGMALGIIMVLLSGLIISSVALGRSAKAAERRENARDAACIYNVDAIMARLVSAIKEMQLEGSENITAETIQIIIDDIAKSLHESNNSTIGKMINPWDTAGTLGPINSRLFLETDAAFPQTIAAASPDTLGQIQIGYLGPRKKHGKKMDRGHLTVAVYLKVTKTFFPPGSLIPDEVDYIQYGHSVWFKTEAIPKTL